MKNNEKNPSTIKTLGKSIRENKKASVLTVLCSMTEVVFEIVIPMCMSQLLDKGIQSGNMADVWKYGMCLLGLALLAMTTGFFLRVLVQELRWDLLPIYEKTCIRMYKLLVSLI